MANSEHTHRGLLEKLSRDCDASPHQLDLVDQLCQFYTAQQVIRDDIAQPLYCACPEAATCWSSVDHSAYPEPLEAEISVPWIGSQYVDHRVCAIAINFNKWGGLGGHWWITRGDIYERLGQGKKTTFPYRVGRYLGAVARSQGGLPPADVSEDPRQIANEWEKCAFLEAVKCSPKRGVGQPTPEMWAKCPPRYLYREIELLAPRIVLAIGQQVWQSVRRVFGVEKLTHLPGFCRGKARLADVSFDVLFVNHPSHGNWRHSWPSLVESLTSRPMDPIVRFP